MSNKTLIISLLAILICHQINGQSDLTRALLSLSRIDLLPRYSENTEIRQVSSHDTTGGNDDGFSGKYSFIRKENGHQVIADLKGPGIIKRIWTPTPAADTIQFYFDGEKKPRINIRFIELFNGDVYPFSRPVVGNEAGGYYCYVPVPFRNSCKIVYKGQMQFIQIDYCHTDEGSVDSSFPVRLSGEESDALSLAVRAWSSIGKGVQDLFRRPAGAVQSETKVIRLKPGGIVSLFRDDSGGRITGFEIEPLSGFPGGTKNIILKASWDNEKVPAINCPLTDFFGYAFGKPSMRSMLAGTDGSRHYCYLPMPYEKNASLELIWLKGDQPEGCELSLRVTVLHSDEGLSKSEGKLYVKWNRQMKSEPGKPYLILETEGKGHYAGTILQAQGLNPGMTVFFEGDDECYIDGELRLHGTGSEDYFNGGWYALPDRWDHAVSLPVHGSLDYSIPLARTGGYRFYISDKLTFRKSFRLTIEHGPEGNNVPVDYTSVAFYYCNKPLQKNEAPANDLLAAALPPSTLEYWLQLLPVEAFSGNSTIRKETWTDDKSKTGYGVMKFSAMEGGYIKFRLDVPSGGNYKLYISYFKGPTCSDFQVSQRQIPVKLCVGNELKNTFVEKEYIGSMLIRENTNTLTISLKGNGETVKDFALYRIYLEKIPD